MSQTEEKSVRQQVIEYVEQRFSVQPEYVFESLPEASVFRRADSRKWFGIIMPVAAAKLGIREDRTVEILNVKGDPKLIGSLRLQPGYFPAYHMNKESWISILLDGTVSLDQIAWLLEMSYDSVGKKAKKKRV